MQQRDNEIAILLSHVNKKAGGGQGDFGSNPGISLQRAGAIMNTEESKESSGG